MDLEGYKDQLYATLYNGEFDKLILTLKGVIPEHDGKYADIIMFEQQYGYLRQRELLGGLREDIRQKTTNDLTDKLFDYICNLKESDFKIRFKQKRRSSNSDASYYPKIEVEKEDPIFEGTRRSNASMGSSPKKSKGWFGFFFGILSLSAIGLFAVLSGVLDDFGGDHSIFEGAITSDCEQQLDEVKEKTKNLVSAGQLGEAIDSMLEFNEIETLEKELLQYKSRLNRVNKKVRLGTISRTDEELERNILTDNILSRCYILSCDD